MIEVIRPEVFKPLKPVHALFTLSNRTLTAENGVIEGLNFGINTPDDPSVIEQNRLKLAHTLGISPGSFAIAEQIHGNHVEVVKEPGLFKKTDGLITTAANITLAIQVADCAAVMVYDKNNQIIGVFHAGWRGAAGEIVTKGVRMMKRLGKNSSELYAYISPSISQENFEVGKEVADQFPPSVVDATTYRKPHVDLKEFLKKQLMDAGVDEDHIEVSEQCTMADPLFYSYRRERDKAGRMLACMYIKKNND